MLWALGLVVAGVVVGAASVLTHGRTPGLVLAAVGSLAALAALPPGWWSRLAFALGWDGVLGYVLLPQPAGDYLVSSDVRGYVLLVLGLLLLLFAVITLGPPRRANATAGDAPS